MLRLLRHGLRRLIAARRRHLEATLAPDRHAYRRARTLLRRHLSPAQRREYERYGAFTVVGPSGRRYRIGYGACINIEVLSRAGTVEYRLCAGPSGVPIPAVMLAQKLMLEAQEAAFLQIAIKHPASPHAF
ncbi:MAG TPA: hypothetical protein VK043_05760 [Burkholderiales bacterium]|nr:hypothetical protein [Burkholderiales bacterium]